MSAFDLQSPLYERIRHSDTAAQADLDRLFVRYGCTFAEVDAAKSRYPPGDPLSDHQRTWVHEQVHLRQATATTFGFFLTRLRRLQTRATLDMLLMLRQHDTPIKLPLLKYVGTLAGATKEMVGGPLDAWYAAERFVTDQVGSERAVLALSLDEAHTASRDVGDLRHLQVHLATLAGLTPPGLSLAAFRELLREEVIATGTRSAEDMLVALRVSMGLPNNTATVLESAARLAESINDSDEDIERRLALPAVPSNGDYIYQVPYRFFMTQMGAFRPRQHLLTFLASADLALCPPILPEHFVVRHGLDVGELTPIMRMVLALRSAPAVPPPTDAGDMGRFQEEVCDSLGWLSPRVLASTTDYSGSPALVDSFYHEANVARRRLEPPIVPGGDRRERSGAGGFANKDFPFAVDSRSAVTIRDDEPGAEHERVVLWQSWMRSLMVSPAPVVDVPWRSPQELEVLAGDLQASLERWLGGPAPPPRLRAAR